MDKERGWGGHRSGSGRKPKDDKRVQMVITVDRSTRDRMKARAEEEGMKVGRLIDRMFGD